MLLSIILLVLLSRPMTIGGINLPAIGHFLNPFTGFWNQAESGKAGSQEIFNSPFLSDSTRIEFDNRMIPHIYAPDNISAFYAQGYLHARNRLFQMELTARAIAGRLSELLGDETLDRDIFARRINFSKIVDDKYEAWSKKPEMMAMVEAYVQGVNDYIRTLQPKNHPLEYKLLSAAPEEWSVRKCIAVSVSLAATLNLNLEDFAQTNTLWNIGPELHSKLFPLFPDTILPIDIDKIHYPDSVPLLDPQSYDRLDYLKDQLPPDAGPGIGSNNWAVRAVITRDSIPMVANDPHLRLTLPNIWYEIQIHSPDFRTHGVSVPGMPSIVIGFNNHISWGMTNSSIDVLDAYKINWVDKEQGTYLLDGETRQATLREEVIHIRDRPSHTEEVYDTWWGPVLYSNQNSEHQNIAVKWMSAYPGNLCDFQTLYELMKARDLEDYQNALHNFYAPGQNIVFASTQDSIAITVQGHFPVKRPDQGRFILDGSSTSNDWKGRIPTEDLPRMINPDRNYVVSANEWPAYPDYPYYYSGKFDQYRGRAISRYLDSYQPLTPEKMKEIQTSNFNLKAAELLPVLLAHIPGDEAYDRFTDSLEHWDYHYEAENPLPTFTEMWIAECLRLSFDEINLPDSISSVTPSEWRFRELLENPDDIIFDQTATPDVLESAADIIQSAWQSARASYLLIPTEERKWGIYGGLNISHLLGIPEFSRPGLLTGGNGNTINATTRTKGPSWRMIVEMWRDSVVGHVIYPGGQSGNPGSRYYDNFVDDWVENKYYDVRLESDPNSIPGSIHYSIYLLPE